MTNKKIWLLLVGILIVAGFFRFYHLTTTPPGLFMDEAMDGVNAQNVAQTGQYKVYYPEDNGREGLYVNILAVAFKYHILPDTAPWSVRFPAAVAGFLTVLGTFLLVSELFKTEKPKAQSPRPNQKDQPDSEVGHWASGIGHFRYPLALLSAFLLATSFWHINFSRIGFRAILAPFCLVWASWFLLKMFRAPNKKLASLYGILGGIVYGLGFYTYIAFRITPLLLLLFIPYFRTHKDFWKRMIFFLLVTFLVALPIGWYYLKHPADFFGRTSQISVTSSHSPVLTVAQNALKTALMFNWHGDWNWRQNISGAPELWWPVGILFIIGIILALYLLVRKRSSQQSEDSKQQGDQTRKSADRWSLSTVRFPYLFLFSWFVLGGLPEMLSNEGIPHALRSLLMVVPACVFAAMGALWLYHVLAKKLDARWMATITGLFIATLVTGAYWQYFVVWAQNPNVPGAFGANYVEIGNEINALPSSTQKYVVIYAGGVVDYGLPMPAEPVLYVTHSFVPDAVAQKDVNNIHYLLPDEIGQIPAGTPSSTIFEIR